MLEVCRDTCNTSRIPKSLHLFLIRILDTEAIMFLIFKSSNVAWWLTPRTPDSEVGVRAPLGSTCCVLDQVLVIPRKRWLRPNMTEKLFTGTLSIKQTKVQPMSFLNSYLPCHGRVLAPRP